MLISLKAPPIAFHLHLRYDNPVTSPLPFYPEVHMRLSLKPLRRAFRPGTPSATIARQRAAFATHFTRDSRQDWCSLSLKHNET